MAETRNDPRVESRAALTNLGKAVLSATTAVALGQIDLDGVSSDLIEVDRLRDAVALAFALAAAWTPWCSCLGPIPAKPIPALAGRATPSRTAGGGRRG